MQLPASIYCVNLYSIFLDDPHVTMSILAEQHGYNDKEPQPDAIHMSLKARRRQAGGLRSFRIRLQSGLKHSVKAGRYSDRIPSE